MNSCFMHIICQVRGVGKKKPASNPSLQIYFSATNFELVSLTDLSEVTLYLWKSRVKMVRYKNGHSVKYCERRALCPCSSAHNTENTKEPKWILGGECFDSSVRRVEHSWWEIINYLDSSFRVLAVSLGHRLWSCEGTDRVEWRDNPHFTVCCKDLLNVSLPLHASDLFRERSTMTKKIKKTEDFQDKKLQDAGKLSTVMLALMFMY